MGLTYFIILLSRVYNMDIGHKQNNMVLLRLDG